MDYLNEFLKWGSRDRNGNNIRRARKLKVRGHRLIFNQLCADRAGIFSWEFSPPGGSPATIDTDVIERGLLYDGQIAFTKKLKGERYEHIKNFPFCTKIVNMDKPGFYGKSTRCGLSDWSGRNIGVYIPILDSDISMIGDCAVMYDNPSMTCPMDLISYYAERLSDIAASINACIANIMGTRYVFAPEEQAKLIENMHGQARIGIPLVIGFQPIGDTPDLLHVFETKTYEETLKTLLETYDKTYADYLQAEGIRANNEVDKKSGITPMEIIENRQAIDIRLSYKLKMRKKGIEHAERLGINGLSVDLSNFETRTVQYDDGGNALGGGGNNDTQDGNTINNDTNA